MIERTIENDKYVVDKKENAENKSCCTILFLHDLLLKAGGQMVN